VDSLLVIIATRDPEKIKTAVMYAGNAKKRGWFNEVEVIFFGPSEDEIAKNKNLIKDIMQISSDTGLTIGACKAVADNMKLTPTLESVGLNVFYVGEYISKKIKNGVKTMVW